MVRFVLGLPARSHVGKEQFSIIGWLPVAQRVNQIVLSHVHKISNDKAPSYLGDHFKEVSAIHNYSTRFRMKAHSDGSEIEMLNSKRFSIPEVKGFGKKTFAYNGCILWNSLPQEIRDIRSISTFKSKVKSHLLQMHYC